ncbi:MAG: pseudouridine synthase, partial [Acidimicrobiia bacterium]
LAAQPIELDRVAPTGPSVSIEVDGVPLPVRPDLVYLLLNKPPGVISTAHDPQGRRTVVDLAATEASVYPVGRLDADSEGLILLTNDGALTNLVTHPRYGIPKAYVVQLDGIPSSGDLRRLREGVGLEDGTARARSARVIDTSRGRTLVEIVMTEGKKREVRRMFDALGHPVLRLVRIAIGPIRDRTLKQGSARRLTVEEVRGLYSAAGAAWEDGPDPPESSR